MALEQATPRRSRQLQNFDFVAILQIDGLWETAKVFIRKKQSLGGKECTGGVGMGRRGSGEEGDQRGRHPWKVQRTEPQGMNDLVVKSGLGEGGLRFSPKSVP